MVNGVFTASALEELGQFLSFIEFVGPLGHEPYRIEGCPPDMARLQCKGSQAVVGPGTRFQLLHTTTETEALQSAGAVTGPVINYGADTLVWRALIAVAKRGDCYYP